MRIGIVGAGNIGSALGNLFAKSGHEVMFSYSHDPQKLQQVGTPLEMALRDCCLSAIAIIGVSATFCEHIVRSGQ